MKDCDIFSKEDCLYHSKEMLTNCRVTCRNYFKNEKHIPESLTELGGLEDLFVDPFGIKIPVCSEGDGFEKTILEDLIHFQIHIEKRLPYIPKFTKQGFKKVKMSEKLLNFLKKHMRDNSGGWMREVANSKNAIPNYMIVQNRKNKTKAMVQLPRTMNLPLSPPAKDFIHQELLHQAEAWSGVKLEQTWLYGVRRYTNNSILFSHVDRFVLFYFSIRICKR